MLFWSAVVNGVLAPPLVVVVTLLASDETVMGNRRSPPVLRWLGWATGGDARHLEAREVVRARRASPSTRAGGAGASRV
jgi:hypothetical protein